MDQELILWLNAETGLQLANQASEADLRQQLRSFIDKLIVDDFQMLVQLLYRIDVNERKLKYLLQENVGTDSAMIIADLIIERQREKIASRRQFNQQINPDTDEERW